MAREAYTKQLTHLQDLVLEMGSMVARTVVEGDKVVNSKNFECQNEVISLITQQAPMARDLRLVVSVAAIMTDLERMGDHAEGIARIVIMMQDEPLVKPLIDIPVMAGHAREMLRDSIQAFVDQDVDAAYRVGNRDDEVDGLYDRIYQDLIQIMISDPSTIEPSTHLLWVAHNLERIADRATNIAERTVYSATGNLPQMDVSSY